MRKARLTAVTALGSSLLLAASTQAVTYDFTLGDGFVDGNITNQMNGWGGDSSYMVDTGAGGSLIMTDDINLQWRVAYPSDTFDAEANNVFTISNVVSWTQTSATNGENSAFNIMINDEVGGGTPIRATLDHKKNSSSYIVSLKSDTGDSYGWTLIPETDLGLDGLTDPDSDDIAFTFTLNKGADENDWVYSLAAYNLTSSSTLMSAGGAFAVSTNIQNAATLYPVISSGVKVTQNTTTNRMVKSFSLAESYEAPQSTIVYWGPGTDIVTNDFTADGESSTYTPGVIMHPVNSDDPYYTNNVGKTPEFNFAGYAEGGNDTSLAFDDDWTGDRIQVSDNQLDQQSMVVWENFLTDDSELKTVSIEIMGYGNTASWSNGNYRILIEKGNGVWYASEASEIIHNTMSDGTPLDTASMTWYSYTPHSGGYPTIATTPSTIEMTDVVSVGYYVQVLSKGSQWIGTRAQSFRATASAGVTSSTVLQWGEAGGDTTITTNEIVDFASKPSDYVDGVEINPAIGTSYYENSTGRSPVFNGAWTFGSGGSGSVRDSGGGDYLQVTDNETEHEAMIVWESFLETPEKITGISTEIYGHGTSNGFSTLRFVVKQDGAWYASDEQAINSGTYTSILVDTDAIGWNDFTPLDGGTGIVGSATSISLTNVASIGYYVDILKDDITWNGTRVRYFRVAGLIGAPVLPPYDTWANSWGVDIGSASDDYEPDGMDNWTEYVLGGDPTVVDSGQQPEFVSGQYVYYVRNDSTLSVYVLEKDDLVIDSTWTTNGPFAPEGTDYLMGTNSFGNTEDPMKFYKLIVE